MADLFSMNRPLAVNYQNGSKTIMVAYYPHAEGMVYLEPYWEQRSEGKEVVVLKGTVKGEGPWKVGDVVISLIGCQNTDAELAHQLADWEFHLENVGVDFYQPEKIRLLAKRYGAIVDV